MPLSISDNLAHGSFTLKSQENLFLSENITWSSPYDLTVISRQWVVLKKSVVIRSAGSGSLIIKAGMANPAGKGTIIFEGSGKQIFMEGSGAITIYYNPEQGNQKHKYHNPNDFSYHVNAGRATQNVFMWVNNARDLQEMYYMLRFKFALSQNIYFPDSSLDEKFQPITRFLSLTYEQVPFSGEFDGNGHTIKGLVLKYKGYDNVGLFSLCRGGQYFSAKISNFMIEDCIIEGRYRVGTICGYMQYTEIHNVAIKNCTIRGFNFVGGVVGSAILSVFDNITTSDVKLEPWKKSKGLFAGAATENEFVTLDETNTQELVGQDAETNRFYCSSDQHGL